MKKVIFLLFFFAVVFSSFGRDYSHFSEYSSEVPALLEGVWQGSDRLLLFSGKNSSFACVLRVFYQWYDDRAAESGQFAQISSRDRNNTSAIHPENISIDFKTIFENSSKTAAAFELRIKYPALKDYVYIPLAVVDGKIFLNFFIREAFYENPVLAGENFNQENPLSKNDFSVLDTEVFFLKDFSAASGITISPPVIKNELLSYVVDGKNFYPVRYWLSQMEESEDRAELFDGEKTFSLPKFIQAAGNLYTCTTGRSSKIRNVKKIENFPVNFIADDDNKIYAYGKEYLVYVPGTENYEQILNIAEKNNQRRHPPSSPVFPVKEPEFRWKEISDIEVYDVRTWSKRNLDIHK